MARTRDCGAIHLIALSVLLAAALGGCEDEPTRPLGGTCYESAQCGDGLCISGHCLDADGDDDGDGLTNAVESALMSNALNPDTDYDGVEDGAEVDGIAQRDTDGDGIPDILESAIADGDSDCLPDELDADHTRPAADLVLIRDKVCRVAGVCDDQRAAIAVSCPADSFVPTCDYSALTSYEADEATCDGLDNDCDGQTDEGSPDADGDGIADCVDGDNDGDGVDDVTDNCLGLSNPGQGDADGDGHGDACDPPGAVSVTGFDPASPSSSLTPTVSGAAEPLATVTLYADAACATELASATADEAGAFSVTVTVADNAETRLFATADNPAGLRSSCAGTFAVYVADSLAPAAPTLLTLSPQSPSDALAVTLRGRAEPLATVRIGRGGCDALDVTAAADVDGLWTASVTVEADQATALWAEAEDAAGNISACAELDTYVHDATAPAQVTFDSASAARFGAPQSGPAVAALSGCAEADATVTVWADAACEATLLAEVIAAGDGACATGEASFAATIPLTAGGDTPVFVRVVDAVGNAGTCDNAGTIVHDDVAPATPAAPTARASDWATGDLTFAVRGLADPGGTVALYLDAACETPSVDGIAVDASGGFFATVHTALGQDASVRARAFDAAGNASGCSPPRLLVGSVEVSVVGGLSGQPAPNVQLQVHAPDGAPLELASTGADGKAALSLFAGCGVTAATRVETSPNGTSVDYHSVLDLTPGVNLGFEVSQLGIADTDSYTLNVTASELPADTSVVKYRSACGTSSDLSPTAGEAHSLTLSSSCVGFDTYSIIAEAIDDDGTKLAYASITDASLTALPVPATPEQTLPPWRTDFATLEASVESTSGPRHVEVTPRVHYAGRTYGNARSDRLELSAIPGASSGETWVFGRLPGMSLWAEAVSHHLSLRPHYAGTTTLERRGLAANASLVLTAPDDFMPEVYDVWIDGAAGEPRTLRWIAEPGLAAEADVLELRAHVSAGGDHITWLIAARPNEDGALALPRFDGWFPGGGAVTSSSAIDIARTVWVDVTAVGGFDQALVLGTRDLAAWYHRRDSGELRTTSCCHMDATTDQR